MKLFRSRSFTPVEGLEPRERILAQSSGTIADTRALVTATSLGLRISEPPTFFPWHTITSAHWEEPTLSIVAMLEGRAVKAQVRIESPAQLLPLVRDRVTDTVIASEHLMLTDTAGATFAARRQPDGSIAWSVVMDSGVNPEDPHIRAAAEAALAELRASLGV